MDTTEIHGVELRTDGDMVVLANNRHNGFEVDTFHQLDMIVDYLHEKYGDDKQLVFSDIGAYTGIYSVYLAKQGFVVESFEPNPSVFNRLKDNVNRNFEKDNLDWNNGLIRYYNIGLSDQDGEAYFHVNPAVELTSGGTLVTSLTRNSKKFRVDITKYDGEYIIPDIIKIDVEGHEMNVLRGMKETLTMGNPFIIIEANTDKEAKDILEYLEGLDYIFQGKYDKRNMIFAPRYIPEG